jgi:cytochrome c1
MNARRYDLLLLLLAALMLGGGCRGGKTEGEYTIATGGSPRRGALLIREYGCGTCHTIPGVREADGVLAPPLLWFARRSFIGGVVPNTPDNLVQWIVAPQSLEPHTAMPAVGVNPHQARDIAAYLYTLR